MRLFNILILFCITIYSLCTYAINDRVTHLPGLNRIQQKQYAGYATISSHKKLFYWFVGANKKNAPIILWSNGGPGYSSLYGFFKENGPYQITHQLQLRQRKHAWNNFANYLVIDQPLNVGLSNIKNNRFDQSRAQAIRDYDKTLRWFLVHHPRYQNRPIYLAGESYAGTYLPLLAAQIIKNNQTEPKINLKGIILVSPWADPRIQQSTDSAYAFTHGFITPPQKHKMDLMYSHCRALLAKKAYLEAENTCGNIDDKIQTLTQLPSLANTAYTTNTNNAVLDRYVNQTDFLQAVHATDSEKFSCFSNPVNTYFEKDIQKSVRKTYQMLLSHHIPILIFSGMNDMKDTNLMGISAFIHAISWPDKSAYAIAKTKPEIIQTKNGAITIGYLKSGGGLTWMKVLNAGHMVAQDQPRIDVVVRRFMRS